MASRDYPRRLIPDIPYGLVNGLMFNVTWFVIVLTESSAVAPVAALLHLAIHFWVVGRRIVEVKFVAQVAVFGLLVDQLLFWTGVFNLAGNPSLPPFWMFCIWPVLATTFMHAFSKLQQHLVLASIFGAIGGAASFIAGTRMTEVAFGFEPMGPIVVAAIWAMIFPLLLAIAGRRTPVKEAQL
ncbi:MAG: hypothetical protein ACI9JM_002353 [Halioglobus sp.]|jgi:hypothetical protein